MTNVYKVQGLNVI